ncbi:helix-turn-helix domain-containing protein [Goodfellowiella coeruleoviolacea]|uniref:Helix-turn-helix domain-containing protein n=1 Tax=Goodfellowiella coeruleoviolacea TaxID=334858 RepID=A0AAE3GEZ6_9PSEU|nr:helix-turn-helix transcriptional regulator [Goodfellowiella coeruleoviolacea]MCP2166094.1 Helix-turn-helix domain-containing protein [Goodfellowiella coeruleoviolacea]
MGRRSSPAVTRRRLALALREARQAAQVTLHEVATVLTCSPAKISQVEAGRVAISVPDLKAMLEHYGVTGERRDQLVALAVAARERGWWLRYRDTVNPWFQQFVGYESAASTLRVYENERVPGLLRTEDYQRALLRSEVPRWAEEDVDRQVDLHRERQRLLDGDDAVRLLAIVNEAALRRVVGTPEVMREQLTWLASLARHDHIVVRVLPFGAGAHPAMSTAFSLLDFADRDGESFVYVEHLSGALFLESADDVARYRSAFDELTANALSRTRSTALIKDIVKSW